MTPRMVIFACVHNAGRSQMAAVLFNAHALPSKARAVSAGTSPADHVHAIVVEALGEAGFDVSTVRPRQLTDDIAAGADLIVTMGCGEVCPRVPGVRHLDWPLDDPKDQPIERVRLIRDEIARRVAALIACEGWI